jgi:uncharacterized damage-inducible protein DinB
MDHRYPIGRYHWDKEITEVDRQKWIAEIAALPERLQAAVTGLSDEQLDTPYRKGGWTIRQVVHHLADSHMNSLIRFKLALTENNPTIRPYYEDRWAELSDSRTLPVEPSLMLLTGLHSRWTTLLLSLSPDDYARTFYHPESEKSIRLDYNLGLYAWHGNHHLAHIVGLCEREGWRKGK